MANKINYVPQIDYTSRDYTSIREDLINLIPNFAPEWTSRDPADFGMTFIELFSYMGDLLSFYVDRVANEGFIATASQRESILQLADILGYTPNSIMPARVTLTFSNSSGSIVTIPAKTQVATTTVVDGFSTQIVFETDTALSVPAASGAVLGVADVTASQGITISNESLGSSTGAPNQMRKLIEPSVVKDSIEVKVGDLYYMYVPLILEAGPYDPVFTTVTDANDYTYIVFGDGISGRVPPPGNELTATYTTSLGSNGNAQSGSIQFIVSNGIPSGISVSNAQAAVGGSDTESTDSIRVNAPQALKALTRAVSLKDYGSLALQVNGISRAIADAATSTSVNLYITPAGEAGTVGTTATTLFTAKAAEVAAYFTDKTPPYVSLNILPATYVAIDLEMTVHVLPQYKRDYVVSQVQAAISDMISSQNSFFADQLPVQYVLNAASTVTGVDYATVELLRKNVNQQSYTVSSWTRSSNVVTLTTSASHTLLSGQTVLVTGISAINGTYVITAAGTNTISFLNLGGDVGATSVSGTVKGVVVETIVCAVNEIPIKGTFTFTGVGGI